MDVVFETFATLMTAALPPDISESQSRTQLRLASLLVFLAFFPDLAKILKSMAIRFRPWGDIAGKWLCKRAMALE